jgi:hypothetical protein
MTEEPETELTDAEIDLLADRGDYLLLIESMLRAGWCPPEAPGD